MKKELVKGFTMLVLIVVLALATAVVSGNAQSAQSAKSVVAEIPFAFSVGYKTMPAGEYSVQTVATAGDALMIRSADGNTSALRPSEATARMKNQTQARLVFHRYGERYFLAEVWNGADTYGRRLLRSQEELGIESELANIASTSDSNHTRQTTYEIVEIAAVPR